jgi:glycine cleavage system aminomethyltransferase T
MDRNGERRIGQITSAVFSPRLQTTIALGYVSRDFVDPGTRVVASSAAGTCLMEVRPLPFVREP